MVHVCFGSFATLNSLFLFFLLDLIAHPIVFLVRKIQVARKVIWVKCFTRNVASPILLLVEWFILTAALIDFFFFFFFRFTSESEPLKQSTRFLFFGCFFLLHFFDRFSLLHLLNLLWLCKLFGWNNVSALAFLFLLPLCGIERHHTFTDVGVIASWFHLR